jgi:dimethylamine monooxygenase subunit A
MSSLFKARYFPIGSRPLRMAAGLHRFGTDFGQAERDRKFFHVDAERPRYLLAKREAPPARRVIGTDDACAQRARSAALAWMRSQLAEEAPEVLASAARDRDARDELDALARSLQEDFCVLSAGDDYAGRAALIDVRLPSGWRPERLRDASFMSIHAPVPGFPGDAQAAQSMVRAMIERGPFVRFVWTLTPDARLDRHPDLIGPASWQRAEGVFLRVERQVTVPLTAAKAGLFLIRVYVYPFGELSAEERARTLAALAAMPEPIRAYKGLPPAAAVAAIAARSEVRLGQRAQHGSPPESSNAST